MSSRIFSILAISLFLFSRCFSQSPTVKRIRECIQSGNLPEARRLLSHIPENEPGIMPEAIESAEYLAFTRQEVRSLQPGKADFLLLKKGYELCALLDREKKFEWTLRRAMLVMEYPEYFPGESEPALKACLSIDPQLCPVMVVEALVREEISLLKKGKIRLEEIAFTYAESDQYFTARKIGAGKLSADIEAAEKRVIAALDSVLPDCRKLSDLYTREVLEKSLSPSDARAVLAMIIFRNCQDFPLSQDLFSLCGEKYTGAWWFRKNAALTTDASKALESLRVCISKETHPRVKALDWLTLAEHQKKRQQFRDAKSSLDSAAALVPDWGLPHIRMAELLVSGASTCNFDPFSRKAVYWAAMDCCREASNRDAAYENLAANMIYDYRQKAPGYEEASIRNLHHGDTWPLGCWMERVTTVRF